MATAIGRVFTTPELLEAILLEVDDMRTLLLSQRVDHTFKATIDSSIRLQRAFWFNPMPPGHSHSQDECLGNPLIRKDRTEHKGSPLVMSGWHITGDDFPNTGTRPSPTVVLIPRQEGSWRKMLLFQPGEFPECWMVAVPSGIGSRDDVWRVLSFSTNCRTGPRQQV